jgi:glycosyltransferase involved in cell wall biosynthesis
VSVVVVAYDMARELPRTLDSLSPTHQRGVGAGDYEVVVVDNGSPSPLADAIGPHAERVRVLRVDPAPPSPARAANLGVASADGALVGLVIDGARLASPGLVAAARLAGRLAERPVITAPGYHLGDVPHMRAAEAGYDAGAEDRLLDECGWREDGYRLFAVSTFGGSSARGWFGPMGESSSLFMPRALWEEVGGLDERFDLPGGGLLNHDLYRRACSLPGARLISLLGEGTFHQIHGGAATSRRFSWDEMAAQYAAIRGRPFAPPADEPLHVGTLPPDAVPHLVRSAEWIARARGPLDVPPRRGVT